MRQLVVLTGPIGAGKSTVAELLAQRLAARGVVVALADLDELALAQRGEVGLVAFWRRAGIAHSTLVRGWFEAGTDSVIAHGPFFESRSYDALFGAAPADARVYHVLLRASFDIGLQRVRNDPERGPRALSKDPDFLRSTYDTFREVEQTLPPLDLEVDTSSMSADDVAERVGFLISGDPPDDEAD